MAIESSRVRVEHRTGLSCSKLEILEFDRADLFARLELENFDRAKVFKELDSIEVRSSRVIQGLLDSNVTCSNRSHCLYNQPKVRDPLSRVPAAQPVALSPLTPISDIWDGKMM